MLSIIVVMTPLIVFEIIARRFDTMRRKILVILTKRLRSRHRFQTVDTF
jgi:hypothetical protein